MSVLNPKSWKFPSSGSKKTSIGNNNANNNSGHNNTIIGGNGTVSNLVSVKGGLHIHYNAPVADLTFSSDLDAGVSANGSSKMPLKTLEIEKKPSFSDEHASSSSHTTASSGSNDRHSQEAVYIPPMDPPRLLNEVAHKFLAENSSRASTRSSSIGSRVTYLKRLLRNDVKNHLPTSTPPHIISYMLTGLLSSNSSIIPLWEPSPSLRSHPQTWRRNVYIGDVGVFNSEGGFDTFFNIFQTLEENRARELDPPPNFYPYKLLPLHKMSHHHHPVDKPKYCGFVPDDSIKGFTNSNVLRFPDTTLQRSTTHCSAIYMTHGFDRLVLREIELKTIDEYIQEHHADWKNHIGPHAVSNRSRKALILIVACDRTKSWSSAAATMKPSLKKRKGTAVLDHILRTGLDSRKVWLPDVEDIETTDGPSSPHMEAEDCYFQNFGTTIDTETRHEIETCNGISIQAYYLDNKWTMSSIRSQSMDNRSTHTAPHPVAHPRHPMRTPQPDGAQSDRSTLPSIVEQI